MNWLAREFGRATVRRIVYLVIAALIGLASSWWNIASAQDVTRCNSNDAFAYCTSKSEAISAVAAAAQVLVSGTSNDYCGTTVDEAAKRVSALYRDKFFACANPVPGIAVREWLVSDPCNGGPVYKGECMTSEKCLARNDPSSPDFPGTAESSWTNGPRGCAGGCEVGVAGWASPRLTVVQLVGGGSAVQNVYTGRKAYTGKVMHCGVQNQPDGSPTPPEATPEQVKEVKKESCMKQGSLSSCVKADGRLCAEASTGKEICWKPGETGTKTDGDVAQVKKPATVAAPNEIALANGDTATKKPESLQVTETKPSGQVSNTTINNYVSNSGANAGNSNDGQPTTESGESGDDGDEDGNGAGGGASCEDPPVTDGDAILGMIARQTWETRCQSERMDKGAESKGDALMGETEGVDDSANSVFGDASAGLDTSLSTNYVGSGGGSCPSPPQIEIAGQTFAWPANFCDILGMIRMLIIASAYLAGAVMVLKR